MSTKSWFGVVLIVILLASGIIGFVLWDESRTSERLAAETEAVGLVALPISWEERDSDGNTTRREGHILTYAYVAGEEVHERTLENITWYEEDETYHICYNPADAADSKLYPSEHVCGS